MTRRVRNRNQRTVHFDIEYSNAVPRRPVGKVNIMNVKSVTDNSNSGTNILIKKKEVPSARDILNDYLESTSVHGLQYFGKTELNVGILGKILWTCTIVTSFVCLSMMIMQFLARYNNNPTNTFIKSFTAPIFQAPFPAVTICPVTPISMRKRLAILENAILPENVSRQLALDMLKYGHHITNPYAIKEFDDMDKFKALLHANKWTVSEFLKILLPCVDIFDSCSWRFERIDCSKSIKESYTSYGVCCSFNYLLEDYMDGLNEQPKLEPLNTASSGRFSGLKLVINEEYLVDSDIDLNDTLKFTNSEGMTVLIHHSYDFPGLNTDMFVLQTNHELEIAVDPQLTEKPSGMQHRGYNNTLVPICITDDENPLEYFPVYGFSNCYANCRVRIMLQVCGCLPFIYNHISKLHNIKNCGIDELPCIQRNTKLIGIMKDIENDNFSCSCRTPCANIDYDVFPNMISLTQRKGNAVVKVFMYSQSFPILITLPAADETYLLASIGGIFSLFFGSSFLSLVEIVYFLYLLCRSLF
ncbi:sodium channel protein Nach-like [Ceratina calcarata]|uniref:Sodium channel protein Nach-like n=1 Tax=Ceratina calcarata TaxID=156304 RepID=A0AAJ7W8Y8_9HYME|nr:sodium channel protein Nach-like [Ceratina calcarata]